MNELKSMIMKRTTAALGLLFLFCSNLWAAEHLRLAGARESGSDSDDAHVDQHIFRDPLRGDRSASGTQLVHHSARSAHERLKLEAAALETIGPPHVPELYTTGTLDNGSPYFVFERLDLSITKGVVTALTGESKIDEIARMLGGINVTKKTIDHAKEMLAVEGA